MFLKTKIGFSCHLGKGLADIKKPRRKESLRYGLFGYGLVMVEE